MIKKLLSFMMLFIVTFCFISGCKDEENEQSILVDEDGNEIIATINGVNYTANISYDEFLNSSETVGFMYEELEDLLIRTVVNVTDSMRNRATNYVEKLKKEAKENATINGTSYKNSLATALSEEGVSSEEELIDKKIFEYQEEVINSQYWNNSKESYYESYLENGYVYHVSQILVSIGTNGNSDSFDVEPSSAVAKKIYDVANALASGESFYNVALRYSDDANSKEKGGDMGLVTLNDTTISDEVKYALANYSIYFENADLIGNEYFDGIYDNGVETISTEYVDLLGTVYNDGTTNYITTISGSTPLYARVYARNIIFNNLFNSRTFRFLESNGTKNYASVDNAKMPLVDVAGFGDVASKNIVVNSDDNPILVVRSDEGIHFVSINKSAFAGEEELKKYYSKTVDYTDNYTTYLEKAISQSDQETKLQKLESLAKDYANMIISGNSNFTDNTVDYVRFDMFEKYLNGTYNGVKFEITNEKVKQAILQYISSQKEYRKLKIENMFEEGFLKHANKETMVNSSLYQKEIPVLSCLAKDENNKYMCTYSYSEGFKYYTSVSGGDSE